MVIFPHVNYSVLTRILHLGVQGPIKTKKVGHLRDRLGRYGIQMYWYIDGLCRQLNNVIFDHSLIITEINFNNTVLYFIYIIAVECQYVNKMNTKQFKLLHFAV